MFVDQYTFVSHLARVVRLTFGLRVKSRRFGQLGLAFILPCSISFFGKENDMLGTILLVILILALLGALPRWRHSRNWGYAPSGGLGSIVLIVVILVLMGRL